MVTNEKINDLVKKIAHEHASIVENECRKIIDKFNCDPKDLIIEYHDNTVIKIKVIGCEFKVNTVYTINDTSNE